MLFRAISRFSTTATTRYARLCKPTPLIKNLPVTLRLIYPSYDSDIPTIHKFNSAKEITTFLSASKHFLIDTKTKQAIHGHQIHMIDPGVTYDVAGSRDQGEGYVIND